MIKDPNNSSDILYVYSFEEQKSVTHLDSIVWPCEKNSGYKNPNAPQGYLISTAAVL